VDRECIIQGRVIGPADVESVRGLVAENPGASRYKLSRLLCQGWDWRDPKGQLKDMAARSLLLKLEERGWIQLPAKRRESPNRMRHKKVGWVEHERQPIVGSLDPLLPLDVRELSSWPEDTPLFECLLRQHHYLSHTSSVGLNLKYLVRDRHGRPVSCLLFGSAAWQCAARDEFIGWSAVERQQALQRITNNTRFLVLPWVEVRHLASHVLSRVLRQLRADWKRKYARPLHLVETFVDTSRFVGRCYRAANWIDVGQTTGRTRQDRFNQIQVPPKRILVYPLTADFRGALRA
jgi:Domain of unknown function (DUF4338)